MRKPIEIKISTVVAVAILIHSPSIAELSQALNHITAGTPDFFDNEFAVIDVETVQNETIDWLQLIALFKSYGLNPAAVRNARTDQHSAITAHGLSIDVVNKPRVEIAAPPESHADALSIVSAAKHVPAMVVDTPVRGGQRIYAKDCDLIITASVNSGAEVIADGSIHIYSTLRGRALAGATGNTDARIFTLGMQAELVSIAGIYRTFENGFPKLHAQQPVQIKLVGDSIEVSSVLSLG